jgi:hypothetical protein
MKSARRSELRAFSVAHQRGLLRSPGAEDADGERGRRQAAALRSIGQSKPIDAGAIAYVGAAVGAEPNRRGPPRYWL